MDRAVVAELPTQVELIDTARVSTTVTGEGRVEWRLDGRPVSRDRLWTFVPYPIAGSVWGLSLVEQAKTAIRLGLAAQGYGAQYFTDGAHPSGLLTTEQPITAEQAEANAAIWHARHQGTRKTAVLGSGLTYQPTQGTPAESALLDVQEFVVREVTRVFAVPPEMVASTSGNSLTYSTLVERDLGFLKYCVGPHLGRLERALTAILPAGVYCKFNTGGLLKTDLRSRYDSYAVALEHGFLTVDEVRELEDRPPLPESSQPASTTPPQIGAVA